MSGPAYLCFTLDDRGAASTFLQLVQRAAPTLHVVDWALKARFSDANGPYLRHHIRNRIAECTVMICLLGERTWSDPWVEWELLAARALRTPIVAVRLHNSIFLDRTPRALRDAGVTPVNWSTHEVLQAIHRTEAEGAPGGAAASGAG